MSFLMIKLQEEKSYRVSPHVASNFFEPTSHLTCRIQLVGSCITGIISHTHRTEPNNAMQQKKEIISH